MPGKLLNHLIDYANSQEWTLVVTALIFFQEHMIPIIFLGILVYYS